MIALPAESYPSSAICSRADQFLTRAASVQIISLITEMPLIDPAFPSCKERSIDAVPRIAASMPDKLWLAIHSCESLIGYDSRPCDLVRCFSPGDSRGDGIIDSRDMREHAARCRSLAEMADDFTNQRLLSLAARYDAGAGRPSRAMRILQMPLELPQAPPPQI